MFWNLLIVDTATFLSLFKKDIDKTSSKIKVLCLLFLFCHILFVIFINILYEYLHVGIPLVIYSSELLASAQIHTNLALKIIHD